MASSPFFLRSCPVSGLNGLGYPLMYHSYPFNLSPASQFFCLPLLQCASSICYLFPKLTTSLFLFPTRELYFPYILFPRLRWSLLLPKPWIVSIYLLFPHPTSTSRLFSNTLTLLVTLVHKSVSSLCFIIDPLSFIGPFPSIHLFNRSTHSFPNTRPFPLVSFPPSPLLSTLSSTFLGL